MNKILALTVLALAGFACAHPTLRQKVPRKHLIVGGEDAEKNELPYQVQLQFNKMHHCGGSIINENYILTAAHCLYRRDKSRFTVIAGEHDILSPTNDGTEQARSVAEILIHENYVDKPDGPPNDIALLKLSSPLELNFAVAPIALPTQGNSAIGMTLVSGWGATFTFPQTTILQKVAVPIITKEVCRAAYGGRVTEDMICAAYPEGGKDSCQGDSGGPMVAYDNGTYLAGVVSWGKGCAEAGNPGVYADVSHFVTWIKQKMI